MSERIRVAIVDDHELVGLAVGSLIAGEDSLVARPGPPWTRSRR